LWAEHDGGTTAQASFEDVMSIPETDEFWDAVIADPGPLGLFIDPVYDRGGATLHALRVKIGDADFFALAREWLRRYDDSSATTEDFEALAESVSGEDLDHFFEVWLHTGSKPTSW
jgi:aminopeptidase N